MAFVMPCANQVRVSIICYVASTAKPRKEAYSAGDALISDDNGSRMYLRSLWAGFKLCRLWRSGAPHQRLRISF